MSPRLKYPVIRLLMFLCTAVWLNGCSSEDVKETAAKTLESTPVVAEATLAGTLDAQVAQKPVDILLAESFSPKTNKKQPSARVENEDILQPADSSIDFCLKLPSEPVLVLKADPVEELEAVIELTPSTGSKTTLTRLALGERQETSIDLKEHEGQFVSIRLSVPASPAGNATVRWSRPILKGNQPEIAAPDFSEIRSGYNILFIVFDALRADYTAPYGNKITKTPAMESLAVSGVLFEKAHATSSWTRPSAASYFTSLRPGVHQVGGAEEAMPSSLTVLPEILKKAGYRTLSVVNNPQVSPTYGFERGFDQMIELFRSRPNVNDPVEQANITWNTNIQPFLDAGKQKPFFIYLHEIDPHSPYTPAAPYDSMYGEIPFPDLKLADKMINQINQGEIVLSEEEIESVKMMYRGEISYMDKYLEAVREKIKALGLEENTLVIFFSDHGEEMFDHAGVGHKRTLHEEVTHVPLIFSLKDVIPRGKRVKRPVELLDLPPTILDLVDEPIPATMQGRSLLADLFASGELTLDSAIFSDLEHRRVNSVTVWPWKLIRQSNAQGVPQSHHLFNLQNDPGETKDQWAKQTIIGPALAQMLDQQQKRNASIRIEGPKQQEQRRPVDPEVRKELEALGYF